MSVFFCWHSGYRQHFVQALESRTLFSAHVGEGNPQLALDIQKCKDDAGLMNTMLQADRAKFEADKKAICDSKKGAKAPLDADTSRRSTRTFPRARCGKAGKRLGTTTFSYS